MLVNELMSRNMITVGPEDNISVALGKMQKARVHQVFCDGRALILKNIITHGTASTKVRHLLSPVPSVRQTDDAGKAAELLVNTGLRAVPVTDGKKIIGVVSETDLIRLVKSDKTADDIATQCVCGKISDRLSSVKALMEEHNVSKIPLLDENNKIAGIVSDIDLIEIMLKGGQHVRGGVIGGRVSKEFLKLFDADAKSVMRMPVIVSGETGVNDVVKILQKNEEVLLEGCRIITPKDVIELLISAKPQKGVYVQITNIHDEDSFTKRKLDQATDGFVHKVGRLFDDIEYLFLHIEKHHKHGEKYHKEGEKIKYSVRTRFATPAGVFVSKAWGFDLTTIAQEALNKLEREVMRAMGKRKNKPKKYQELRKERE